jgi:hypothetical protein
MIRSPATRLLQLLPPLRGEEDPRVGRRAKHTPFRINAAVRYAANAAQAQTHTAHRTPHTAHRTHCLKNEAEGDERYFSSSSQPPPTRTMMTAPTMRIAIRLPSSVLYLENYGNTATNNE